jgi:hypothetical protein
MKKLLLLFCTVTALHFSGHAQCQENFRLESSKTEYLDESGNVKRTVEEQTVTSVTGKEIVIRPASDHTMTGEIKLVTCNWKVPFKEGTSTMDVVFFEGGKDMKVTVVIENKDNKISMTLRFEEEEGIKIIRVWADKFEPVRQRGMGQ